MLCLDKYKNILAPTRYGPRCTKGYSATYIVLRKYKKPDIFKFKKLKKALEDVSSGNEKTATD